MSLYLLNGKSNAVLFLKLENILADFLCGEKCFYISFLSKLYLEGCPKIFPETVPLPEEKPQKPAHKRKRKINNGH
jgi:hypothetical protein